MKIANIEDLIDRIHNINYSKLKGTGWFTSIDRRSAYGQLNLTRATAQQCHFSLVGGPATGSSRFLTRFHVKTLSSAQFQQAINGILIGTKGTDAFTEDILVCTKGTIEEHLAEVQIVLQNLITQTPDSTYRKLNSLNKVSNC